MNNLANKKCVPCEGDARPLTKEQYNIHLKKVKKWIVEDGKKIKKKFEFKNFNKAVDFVNRVATLAEDEGHHPDILLHNWKCVTIILSTHAIGGLSLNDFILAAKIDTLV